MSNARATSPGSRPPGGRRHGADQGDEVPSITNAPESLEEDQARRTRRYLVQMGIRLVCFVGAIVVDVLWIRLVLIAAAVVLPYSAVLFANAGRDRISYDTSPVTDVAPAGLPAPDVTRPEPFGGGGHRVVEHRDDEDETEPPAAGTDGTDSTAEADSTDEDRGGDR